MQTNPILLDVPYSGQDCIAYLKLREGRYLAAKVVHIKGEIVLLLLNSRIAVQSRLCTDLQLVEGQELKLRVKELAPSKLVLEVTDNAQPRVQPHKGNLEYLLKQIGTEASHENIKAVKAILDEGLPVTQENINFITGNIKSLRYLLDNIDLLERTVLVHGADILELPVGDIAKAITGFDKGCADNMHHLQNEKVLIMKDLLEHVCYKDVAKLLKLDVKPTLSRLAVITSLMQKKSYIKEMVKLIPYYRDIIDSSKRPYRTEYGKIEHNPGIKQVKIDPLIQEAVIKVNQREGDITDRVITELLVNRVAVLDKVLKGINCSLILFAVDDDLQEAIIMVDEGKEGSEEKDSRKGVTLFIEAETPHVGRIGVTVTIRGQKVDCRFLLQDEGVCRLIEQERGLLNKLLQEIGYGLSSLSYVKKSVKEGSEEIKCLDVRV